MRKYSKTILIKAGDSSEGRMLMTVKTENPIIDKIPHKTINTVIGKIYYKEIRDFSEE